jgi:multiple sugar transport system permease protein
MPRLRGGTWWRGAAGGLVVAGLALVMLVPFLYMAATALMDQSEVLRFPPPLVPARAHPENFGAALTALPFGRFYWNSAVFALCVVAGQVVTSTTAAYAFARLRFPGRDRLFVAYLATLMVPAVALVVPRFMIINAFGWVDTFPGLVSTELVSVGGIFLLRQFFLALPRELEDAARLDGASEWTVFRRVALPLAEPAIVALAVVGFVDQWKSFLWPLVATRSSEMQVVEVGLASLHGLYATNWPLQMAAAVTAVVPLVVVYSVAQRHFLRGIELTAPR